MGLVDAGRAALTGLAGLLLAAAPAGAMEGPPLLWAIEVEQLEYRLADGEDALAWDADAFLGRDEWKLRLLSEGAFGLDEEAFEELEHRLVLQRPVSDFFDAKAGVRLDTPDAYDQVYGVLGLQGLAPQWIEVDLDLFVSDDGDVSARLDAEYELLITNYLILLPSLELDFPFTDDEERELAAGAPMLEVGARLSYDLIDRALAPYVGVFYETAFGETADLVRGEGGDDDTVAAVFGVRLLF